MAKYSVKIEAYTDIDLVSNTLANIIDADPQIVQRKIKHVPCLFGSTDSYENAKIVADSIIEAGGKATVIPVELDASKNENNIQNIKCENTLSESPNTEISSLPAKGKDSKPIPDNTINHGKKRIIIIAAVLIVSFFALPRCFECGKICFSNRISGTMYFFCDDCYADFRNRPLNIRSGSGNSSKTSSSKVYVNVDSKDDNYGFAVAAAQSIVKEKLKSPSTAKFPWGGYSVKKCGNDFIVEGYVDAENSFGATIRTNWKTTFTMGDTSGEKYKISNYQVTLYE